MWVRLRACLTERDDGMPAWRRLLWFALLGVIAVAAGFKLFSAEEAGRLIKHGGYYAIASIFAWWCWAVFELVRFSPLRDAAWWRDRANREAAQVCVLIAILLAIALLTVPRNYKVLFDEAVIQSTAWNLHMEREVGALNRAHEVGGLLHSLDTYLDKRPYFYAFLVSLVHDFTGYREANGFWLNTCLLPLALGLTYWLGRRCGGHAVGVATLASLGAFSLLAINARGAGLEMLNLTLILGLIVAAVLYLETPDAPRLSFLVLTAVLLANTRYESAIYVGSAGLVVIEGWRRAGRFILPLTAIFAPLLLVPYALHNTYLSGTPRLWELREGHATRFGFGYLEENLGFAWTYFLNLRGLVANSPWLTYGGFGALLVLAVWAWRYKPRWQDWRPVSVGTLLVALGVVGNLCLLMAYYWGDLSDPVVSRLSLPLQAILALCIAAALARLPVAWRGRAAAWATVLAFVSYIGVGAKVNQQLFRLNTIETAQRWEFEVLERRGPAKRLVITDKSPLSWFVRGVPSITAIRLLMKPGGLPFHLAHHSFDEVIVTQTLRPSPAGDGFILAREHALPEGYVLEQIAERRIGAKLQRICVLREILPGTSPSEPDLEAAAEPDPQAKSPIPHS